MSNRAISVYAEALKRQQEEEEQQLPTPKKTTSEVTRKPTQVREPSRDNLRETRRENPRRKPRSLPSRDEIQEFSFSLRDELKVKVQAEVPHRWQKELEEVARELNVKKLELYRFILGEFLGKVKREEVA